MTFKKFKVKNVSCVNSMDKMVIEEGVNLTTVSYPPEYLNTLNAPGIPLSRLQLMILRNLNPSNGLCNGTRAILTVSGDGLCQPNLYDDNEERTLLEPLGLWQYKSGDMKYIESGEYTAMRRLLIY